MICATVLSYYMPGETEQKHENTSVSITRVS